MIPISPCGSVMDFLRSGYSTSMYSFAPDGSVVPFTARWYKAPPHSVELGVRHQYASNNYHQGVNYPEQVGEIFGAPRPWNDAHTPPALAGDNHCGSEDQWVGQLARLAVPIPSHPDGQPLCCHELVVCTHCLGGYGQASYRVHATGGSGDFAVFNGDWICPNLATCFWEYISPAIDVSIQVAATFVTIELQHVGTGVAVGNVSTGAWDCQSDRGGFSVSGSTGSGTPPTVSIEII